MKKLVLLLISLLIAANCFADIDPIQKVQISPLEKEISFSTVELLGTGWVTAPSVEMRGRVVVSILNTSTSNNVFVSDVSGGTAQWTIYPKQAVTWGVSSDRSLYMTSNSVISVTVFEAR